MQSYFNPELTPLVDTATRFAKKEILGKVVDLESLEKPGFPWEAVRSGGEAGFLTGPLDEERLGANLELPALSVLIEHLAEGAAGPAVIFAAHLAAVQALSESKNAGAALDEVARHCSDEKPLLLGMTLPATSVDLYRPAAPQVEEQAGDLFITGDFICLPSPEVCRWTALVTSELDGRVLLVDADRLKAVASVSHPGSGLDEFPSATARLDGFRASDDEIVEGASSSTLVAAMRLLLTSAQVGNARAGLRTAWEYAEERFQTGVKIIDHQEVRRMLESMAEKVEAATGAVRLASETNDDSNGHKLIRRIFTFVGTVCEDVCQDAVQCHGGYGYMKDYGVEKRLRDSKSLQCILGTYPEDILGGMV